ncbi:FMN-binding protein [Actinomadura decatromicini]|uniref:FMN-binding protein n=1 Tax=Actinomadura decatromicini TaxID=2604572 RepID=A0A5D3F6C1_9ACTN|nr:FMN-binding protein [Actinomadura decatromicini]TYK43609.1 FMN-binding protein [Actinomadura decatromicini]
MRRMLITTGATLAGVTLLLAAKPHRAAVLATPPPAPEGGPTTRAGGPADGAYRGDSVETKYGPVQVEITMSGGRLAAVRVLKSPSESGRDREIAAMSLPRLTREALAAGSAHIDAVSGASYTSDGYITSLQSALDRAHG